jgi:hypothetical protein
MSGWATSADKKLALPASKIKVSNSADEPRAMLTKCA